MCRDYKPDAQNMRLAEKLTQCATYEAEFSLLDAARTRSHARILNELENQDGIANEIKYHRTCFSLYVNKKSETSC